MSEITIRQAQAVAQVQNVDEKTGKTTPAQYPGNNKPVIPNIQGARNTPLVTGIAGFFELYVGATNCIQNLANESQ